MAQNSIEIFDDTVLKLTVNQGTEKERSEKTLGNFNMGEVAFVRDTGRLFVGDCSDDEKLPTKLDDGELNYTKGGALVGNKYLGLIDSKPLVEVNADNNGIPLNLEDETTIYIDDNDNPGTRVEKPLIKDSTKDGERKIAKFKRPFITDDDENEVGRWDRKAEYNEMYDAYNGDFVYDVYRNALILFDKNISYENSDQGTIVDAEGNFYTTNDEGPAYQIFKDEAGNKIEDIDEKIKVKRRTYLQNYKAQSNGSQNNDTSLLNEVYGHGYVIFRNVEPDNETLEFKKRSFRNDGQSEDKNKNYSHNILTIKNIPSDALISNFDKNQFETIAETGELTIKPKLTWATEIGTDGNSLTIPNNVTVSTNGGTASWTMRLNTPEITDSDTSFLLTLKKVTDNSYIVDSREAAFQINLGAGLSSEDGLRFIKLSPDYAPTILLDGTDTDVNSAGDPDPYLVYTNEIDGSLTQGGAYAGNLYISGSVIKLVNKYTSQYYNAAKEYIEKYANTGNVNVNHLINPVPLVWSNTGTAYTNEYEAILEFCNAPYIWCNSKSIYKDGARVTSEAEFNNAIMVLGKNSKDAQDPTKYSGGPIDYNTIVTGDVNARKFVDSVPFDNTTNKVVLASANDKTSVERSEILFKWIKTVYAAEEGYEMYVPGEYTLSGVDVDIVNLSINGKLIIVNGEESAEFANFPGIVKTEEVDGEEEGRTQTTYTLYTNSECVLQSNLHKIYYDDNDGASTQITSEEILLENKGKMKFSELSNFEPTEEDGVVYVANKSVAVKSYYKSTSLIGVYTLVENITAAGLKADLAANNFIVLNAFDPDDPESTTLSTMFYTPLCLGRVNEFAEPTNIEGKDDTIPVEDRVRIPNHASKALLEVTVYTTADSESNISIHTAKTKDDLRTPSDALEKAPYTAEDAYSSSNKLKVDHEGKMNPGENETTLLSVSANRHVSIIKVPLYSMENVSGKSFCLRIADITPGSKSCFMIKLIGYEL